MSKDVKVIVLRTAGTNCDQETVFVFEHFGASVDLVHINQLISKEVVLEDYHILALPGGFTYGDDIAAGRILANELRLQLGKDIQKFIDDGKLIIGICNGFQILVKTGILPGIKGDAHHQTATLTNNDSGKFEDRWTYLSVDRQCAWTQGLKDTVYFPVAHAEGKFVVKDQGILDELKTNDQIAFRYCTQEGNSPEYPDDPNGSVEHIAGITDKTGRVLGLMPHPERHFFFHQHPFWTRLEKTGEYGDGAKIFENGINYVKSNLLNSTNKNLDPVCQEN